VTVLYPQCKAEYRTDSVNAPTGTSRWFMNWCEFGRRSSQSSSPLEIRAVAQAPVAARFPFTGLGGLWPAVRIVPIPVFIFIFAFKTSRTWTAFVQLSVLAYEGNVPYQNWGLNLPQRS